MITGADVVSFRQRRSLTRKQLATIVGLTEAKIWRIEEMHVFKDDEEERLVTAGVMAVTYDEEPPIQASTQPPPISSPVVIERPVAEEVDLAELSQRAGRTYSRYISNSELQTFKRCRRKWFLAWHRGLRAIRESPVGTRQVGARLHLALKAHYVPGGPPARTTMLDELERLITLERSNLDGQTDDEERMKFEQDADLERIMLEGYVQWLADTGADADLKVIAPETYLEAALSEFNETVAIIGKLDVRVQRTTDGAILFLDHKSLGEFTKTTRLLPITEQMMHYQLLEELNAPEGQHVAGALYNMMRRVKRTGSARPPFYQRVEVHHNAHVMRNYRRRIVGEITDILEVQDQLQAGADHQTIAYPSPTRDCYWDCPFLQVCPMFDDGSRAEDMLAEHYTAGDPLSYYMTEMLGEEGER